MKITAKKINQALRETNWSLYLMGDLRNYRVKEAKKGYVYFIEDKPYALAIHDKMRFIDGRSGQEVSL